MQSKTCTFAELFPDLVDSSGEALLTMEDLKTAKTLAQQFELASRKLKNRQIREKKVERVFKVWFSCLSARNHENIFPSRFFEIIIHTTHHQSSSLAKCRKFVELDPAMTTSVQTVLQPQH